MQLILRRPFLGSLSLVFFSSAVAFGHVTVAPREAAEGAEVRYTARVPTETSPPTVRIEVRFPDDIDVSEFVPNRGWTAVFTRNDAGKIVSVTVQGGSIPPRETAEFTFIATNPDQETELVWEIRQSYENADSSDWTPTTRVTRGN